MSKSIVRAQRFHKSISVLVETGSLEDVLNISWFAFRDKKNRMFKNYELRADLPNTLLHKFLFYEEFRNNLSVLKIDERPIACASWYALGASDLLLSRSYVLPKYRNKWLLTKVLEHQVSQSKRNSLLVSFNEETKGFYNSLATRPTHFPKVWQLFKPIGYMNLNNVDQLVIEYKR